ncbi:unnamed protein product [Brachionus calyciflorus]|uniref:Reverse transcriptase domain-containing protein n=1 Tax=Brachionus calyciflorus TaxID=104777 RepID=A0A814HHR5_9BILA|nr:unnamed protein product [Brachionus calyciflorus]
MSGKDVVLDSLTDITEHDIDTGNTRPIKRRPYRLPQSVQEEVSKQVDDMLKKNIIRESKSPWCSPFILVIKKKADEMDCYPLPRIDDTVDALGGSKYFTTFDLASGYWQIPLNEESKSKTAFCANSKLYEFNVMPFGLCNAPPTFQRLMDDLLKNLTWKHCLVYLDDVIVFASDFKTHLERLDEVLRRFAAANLKLRPSKCKFVMDELQEFDFEIIYYPGSLNFTADQLSRPPVHQDLSQTLEVKTLEFQANIDWEREQDGDKEIAIVKANLKTSSSDDWESLKFFQIWNRIKIDLVIKLGILYKKDQDQLLIVVPSRLTKLVCKLYHDSISAGHLGFEKTMRAISVRFIWPYMKADVYDYCWSCDTCQKFKVKNTSNKVPLVSINIDKAWDLVGIDVAGLLKKTKLGYNYFILAVDYFSKFCIGEAKANYTGETSKEFLREIVNRYGTPAAIIILSLKHSKSIVTRIKLKN